MNKYRYRFKQIGSDEIITVVLDLTKIEIQGFSPNPFGNLGWDILSRDQFTGKVDNNGKELFANDVVNLNHEGGTPMYAKIQWDTLGACWIYYREGRSMHLNLSWTPVEFVNIGV